MTTQSNKPAAAGNVIDECTEIMRQARIEQWIQHFKDSEKLNDESEKYARAIFQLMPLTASDVKPGHIITFKNQSGKTESQHIVTMLIRFLEKNGKVKQIDKPATFTDEEAEFYRSHGMDPAEVAKYTTEADMQRMRAARKRQPLITPECIAFAASRGIDEATLRKYNPTD